MLPPIFHLVKELINVFQNPYGTLSKCTVEAIEKMEKSGQQHQEESDQVAEQIASDFCTWLRALPKGETEDINHTSSDYIRQLFDERVGQLQIPLSALSS